MSARALLFGLLGLLAACAAGNGAAHGTSVAGPTVTKESPGTAPPTDGQPQINTRAKLLFEDANKLFDQQQKAKNLDYAALEHKYQAALDADGARAEAEYDMGVLEDRQGHRD